MPEHVELEVPSRPIHVRDARRQVRAYASRWELPDQVIEDLMLATSELVTNAIVHAESLVRLSITHYTDHVRLEVQDDHPRVPLASASDVEAPSGRGLAILHTISRSWGVESIPGDGKRVWAELATAGQ